MTEDIEAHIQRKYEIAAKLGKGVSEKEQVLKRVSNRIGIWNCMEGGR